VKALLVVHIGKLGNVRAINGTDVIGRPSFSSRLASKEKVDLLSSNQPNLCLEN